YKAILITSGSATQAGANTIYGDVALGAKLV
ncbi:MAG: hypothetical protein QOE14_838, partial [Humisphaera sp.]|nr:hypothetical protein [Humisphaera sp.]